MRLKPLLPYILIFAVTAAVGSYIRLYPLLNYRPGDSKEKATLLVIAQLRKNIEQKLMTAQPGLTPEERGAAAQDLLGQTLSQDKEKFRQAVDNLSLQLSRDSGHEEGFPYLLASDSYHFLDLTRQLKEQGYYSDTFKGSKYLNRKMMAPLGHWEPITWHPYMGLFVDWLIRIFKPEAPLMFTVSFTSMILAAASIIPFMWLCRLFHCPPAATFLGTMFYLCAPIVLKRSMFAWYDNDAYNLIFPSLIFGWVIWSFSKNPTKASTLVSGAVTALFFAVYAYFWQGWMFLLCVLAAASVGAAILSFLRPLALPRPPHVLSHLAITVLGVFLLISVLFGPRELIVLFQEGFKALSSFITPQLAVWPDIYMTVGELHDADMAFIAEMNSGWAMLSLSLLGWLYALYGMFQNRDGKQSAGAIYLIVYLACTLFISLGAQRFVLLTTLPLAVGFALATTAILNFISWLGSEIFRQPLPRKILSFTLKTVFAAALCFKLISVKDAVPALLNPIYNETWDRALNEAREKTPPDSIITTWWPPGHFIKCTAQRRVTFDGASINYPQAYWLSDFFLQTDEIRALGILRMLNNSAHKAADYLMENTGLDVTSSVSLLKEITRWDAPRASIILNSVIKNQGQAGAVLKMTHAKPAPSYILLYNEFVTNNTQLRFIGNWNFREIEAINKDPKRLAAVPRHDSKEYIDFLWVLAGGPSKFSEEFNEVRRQGSVVEFPHGLSVDLSSHAAHIDSPKFGKGRPQSIFYKDNRSVIEKVQEGTVKPYSVVLYTDGGNYRAVLMDRSLAKSMLVQMYYFDAAGLKHIKPLIHQEDLTRRTVIKIFEVNWEGFFEDTAKQPVSNPGP